MPAVTLKGMRCSGHGAFAARACVSGEDSFTINGQPVVVVGCAYAPHTDTRSTHGGHLSAGARGFTINGKAVGRMGDPISCGSRVAEGLAAFTIAQR